jgi:ATP-dependent RNA helicase DOB1
MLLPDKSDYPTRAEILTILLDCVECVSSVRLYISDRDDLTSRRDRLELIAEMVALRKFQSTHAKNDSDVFPTIRVNDLTLNSMDKGIILDKTKSLADVRTQIAQHLLSKHDSHRIKNFIQSFTVWKELKETIQLLEAEESGNVLQKWNNEVAARVRILSKLGFVNQDGIVQEKGKVAEQLNTCDELLLTEAIFSGLFNRLTPAEIAAICSLLLQDERPKSGSKGENQVYLAENLLSPIQDIQKIAANLAQVCDECGLQSNVEKYKALANMSVTEFGEMCQAVYLWANGATFEDVMADSKLFEGSIIRVCRRITELCFQLSNAVIAIGDTQLSDKFDQMNKCLRHGIVFAASLYL